MKQNNTSVVAIIFAAFILVAMIIVVIVGLLLPEKAQVIQGEIETTDYRVSSKVPSRVLQIRVEEGDFVKKGDTLVILESPEVSAKLEQANAVYQAAAALDEKARNGAQKEQITGAYELWQKAIAGLEVAEKSYKRVQSLFEKGVVSEQKRDETKAQYDAMVATEKAAKSQYEMAKNGARIEDKKAAAAKLAQANGAVNEVNAYVGETILLAMEDGQVTEIFPEIGELVGSGAPIMNVAISGKVWATFNVREDYLPTLNVGKEISAYVPALGKDVTVKISRIKNVGNFATWKATKTSDGWDLKMFEVRAIPVNDALSEAQSGMSIIIKDLNQ